MLSRYKHFFLLIVLIISLLSSHLFAQQYHFKNYGTKNGLGGSTVTSIFQDNKGYVWIATQGGGVSRFDGKQFKNYTKKDGLVSNDITCINQDKDGNIWIGSTDGGVSKYNGSYFTNYTEKEGLANNLVYTIYCDEQNKLWFATSGGGVSVYSNGKFIKTINKASGLSSDVVFSIVQDKQNNYWFALDNGISKYDGKIITNYNKHPLINKKVFFSSLLDSKGIIWFGSINEGILKYDGKKFEKIALPKEVAEDFIGAIVEDKKNNIWIATDHGVLKLNNGEFTLYNEYNGLSSNSVLSLTVDYEDNLLLGTQAGGVNVLTSDAFAYFTTKNGLITNKITTIGEFNNYGYVLGSLSAGISTFSSTVFNHVAEIPELKQSIISSVATDINGNLWVGTQNEGVFILNKKGDKFCLVKHIDRLNNLELALVVNIFHAQNGDSWIATFGRGLFKLNDDKVINYSKSNGDFASDNITTMYIDTKSNIWLGTNDAGIIKMAPNGLIINYTEKDGLPSKSIWSIAEDDKHNLYFGTNDAGIITYNSKEFNVLDTKNGLCSNNVPALAWDKKRKNLIAGTDKGVNKLYVNTSGSIDSLRYYGEHEGFKGGEVNQGAILIDSKGLVWFGTTNGLFRYNPKYDYNTKVAPKLSITGIRLAYQNVDWKKYTDSVDTRTNVPKSLTLSYENNHLTFDFQALTTSDVKYSYILEGLDKEWSPLSGSNEANYTNIPPGKTYTFRVKAINNNGVESDGATTFTFSIKLPWWQTWWFYLLVIAFITIAVIMYINYRTAKLAKEKQLLEQKVAERTLELNTSNMRLSEAINAITDSMNYAQRIQQSFLTSEKVLNQTLKNYFILYKPRDIVSGDFYWSFDLPDRTIVACADCTGHGIPGAFMSLIGISLLNEISHSKGMVEPAAMLDELRRIIIMGLNPEHSDSGGKDGMDITLISILKSGNTDEVKIQFAGANNVLCVVSKHNNHAELLEYKGDKQPVGFHSNMKSFTQQEIALKKGDMIYMFTDGYADQFGGERGKKYMARQLKKILLTVSDLPTNTQKTQLEANFNAWKGDLEQIDDVTVLGIKLS
ncbi:MAG: two-component regulator propeller domain-containing protein [Bacteroidia bacterium]